MNEPKVRVTQLNLAPPATTALSPRICDGLTGAALSSRYTETEYLISGVAHGYTGSAAGPVDVADRSGRRYTTRVLVRRPRDPATAAEG